MLIDSQIEGTSRILDYPVLLINHATILTADNQEPLHVTITKNHMEGRLSLDWPARNLLSHACLLLANKPLLSHLILAGLCQ